MYRYYKIPVDKIRNVLIVMSKTGWTWNDNTKIESRIEWTIKMSGDEYAVFGVDYSRGEDTGKLYKRIYMNPDWNHDHKKKPPLEFEEFTNLLNPVVSGSY